MTINKIADRVRKLLALANNNPNEEEAASAAALAAALLAEHNLTMAQVECGADEARVNNEFETRNWCREMRHALADLNFCYCVYTTVRRGHDWVTIIGTQANVETTKVMLDYLVQTANRLATEQCHARDRRRFCIGFSDRVAARLDAMRKQRAHSTTQATTGTTLPVLASLYAQHAVANEDLFKRLNPNERLGFGHRLGSGGGGYEAGYAAGDAVSLDPQVGRANRRKALR
jgi:hypothetical protein